LASDNPAASTLVSTTAAAVGQAQAPGETGADLAHFTFSGTGTITQVVVNRIGVSSDASINNVYLYQGNNRITDAGSFSNGAVTFANSNGLFTVNGSYEVSVRVDVAGGISGQTIGAQLASFTVANGSPMATSISGNLFTVAQISNLATVTVSSSTVVSSSGASFGVNSTINAGTTNAVLWSAPINVSQRTVLLKYIAFTQIGSISQSAIQNLKLMVDGTQYGATASITSSGSSGSVVIFDLTGSPVSLTTGSHTLALNGDIISGTSYTYNFTLQSATDAVFYDTNYMVNVPFVNSNTNQQVIQLSPGTTTISSGSVAVQLDPTFAATQFVKNASQVDLGQWTMKAYGEAVKVQTLNVVLNYFLANGSTYVTPSSTDGFNNLSLFVNGGQVGSSLSAISPTVGGTPVGSAPTYTFGSTNLFTIPAGTTVTVEVKGDSVLSSTDAVAVVRADIATPVNSLQGVTSYALSGGQPYTGVSLSTNGSTGTLNANTGYSVPTFSPNMSNQHIGSYIVQAGSADGVRVTSLTVGLNTVGLSVNNFANLYIVTPNGQTTPVQPSGSNNFSVNFSVPINQTATVDVYADISNATGTASTTMFGTGQGVTSNQSVSLASAGSPAIGQTISVSTGSLGAPTLLTSASPVAQLVAAGSTNQAIATFFATSTSGTTITELGFSASGTGATLAQDAISSVTVGGVTTPMTGTTSLVTGLSIAVPSGFGGVNIPVTVNYTPFGATPFSNKFVQLILSHIKTVSGGQTTTSNAPVYASGGTMTPVYSPTMLVVGTVPTVSLAAPSSVLTTGTQEIATVTVTPGSTGNMILTQLPVTLGTSTVNILPSSLSLQVGNSVIATTPANGTGVFEDLVINNGGYNIQANTPVTFAIYGTVTGSTGVGGSSSVVTSVQPASSFLWTDVTGNAAISSGGTYIVNYPTGSVSIHN
jgi:hypothetical protein